MKKSTAKKFWLFAGPRYYPLGGWLDFVNSYDSLAEAEAYVTAYLDYNEDNWHWWHVVNAETGEVAARRYLDWNGARMAWIKVV